MKRSNINQYIDEALTFFNEHRFYLPEWVKWSPEVWNSKGEECNEICCNQLGWDVTDFSSGAFLEQGLTLVTIRNGNIKRDKKVYCEKIMMVREDQVTPIHFHWKKMEDIINRGGGILVLKLWRANINEELTMDEVKVQIDGVTTKINSGETFRLKPGQSITFEPYIYHTFWAEGGHCMVGEVSTVNDDVNDNRFLNELGRFSEIEEDEKARFILCNEYESLIE